MRNRRGFRHLRGISGLRPVERRALTAGRKQGMIAMAEGGTKFETTHEVAAKERHRKKPSKKDGEKRREEKLRGRKRVVSENKAATAQKGKALRHGKGFRGR